MSWTYFPVNVSVSLSLLPPLPPPPPPLPHTVKPAFNDPVYPSSPVNGYVQRTERMNVVVDAGFDVEVTASASLTLEFSFREPGVPLPDEVMWFYQGQ